MRPDTVALEDWTMKLKTSIKAGPDCSGTNCSKRFNGG